MVRGFVIFLLVNFLLAGGVLTRLGAAEPPLLDAPSDESSVVGKTQWKRAVSAALRDEARARRQMTLSERGGPNPKYCQSVVRLCDCFAEIRGDQRYVDSEMLQKMGITLRHRLLDIARTLETKLQRGDVERPAWIETTSAAIRQSTDLSSTTATSSAGSDRMHGAAGGAAIDNGWQLVELIQQTIEPGFWDVTGGPGTVYYFALKRALVVRATSEVHADLGNTLRQINRN